jgi:hypothetical protein
LTRKDRTAGFEFFVAVPGTTSPGAFGSRPVWGSRPTTSGAGASGSVTLVVGEWLALDPHPLTSVNSKSSKKRTSRSLRVLRKTFSSHRARLHREAESQRRQTRSNILATQDTPIVGLSTDLWTTFMRL